MEFFTIKPSAYNYRSSTVSTHNIDHQTSDGRSVQNTKAQNLGEIRKVLASGLPLFVTFVSADHCGNW